MPRPPGSPANVPLPGLGGLWWTSPEDGLRYTDAPPRAIAWSEGSHLQAAETGASTPGVPAVSGRALGAGQSVWTEAECPLAAPPCIGSTGGSRAPELSLF